MLKKLAFLVWLAWPMVGAAQSGGVYVNHERVTGALAKGGVLLTAPQVAVSGGHQNTPGALETQKGTSIFYVTDGDAVLVAGDQTQRLTKGDVLLVPAGTARSFKTISQPISFYMVTVPVLDKTAKSSVMFVDHEKVAATLKKAGPLADGPNLRVSGGFRNGPYVPADNRPDVEVHANEADLFYVIDGDSTQITGGTVIGGRDTGPGQIRGSKIDGGQTHHLATGDVMWVPAGMPHWFPEMPRALSYLLVKVFY